MKTTIQIKSMRGEVLFELEKENNTLKETLIQAVKSEADLSGANLSGANLSEADLRGAYLYRANLYRADLSEADLSGANLYRANLYRADLRRANLSGANLSEADLRGAYLYGIKFEHLPQDYINQCSRDILFVLEHLKPEVPFLREKLIAGEVDGSTYMGECACLLGTLANGNGGLDKVCEAIPFYDKGTHNPGESWFLNIRKGDTPENNEFAKHALTLIDMVLGKQKTAKKRKAA